MTIYDMTEYKAIAHFYGSRTAERSGVPLINHIHEGIAILQAIEATEHAIRAFCLHPLLQSDDDLLTTGSAYLRDNPSSDAYVVMLAMEYRWVANNYLSHCVLPPDGVHLSAVKEVNDMLIADKVQNRKDFELFHKGTHERSDRLDQYFKEWLSALGVSDEQYDLLHDLACDDHEIIQLFS